MFKPRRIFAKFEYFSFNKTWVITAEKLWTAGLCWYPSYRVSVSKVSWRILLFVQLKITFVIFCIQRPKYSMSLQFQISKDLVYMEDKWFRSIWIDNLEIIPFSKLHFSWSLTVSRMTYEVTELCVCSFALHLSRFSSVIPMVFWHHVCDI